MVWKQEEVCNRGIYPGREATSFYCRTSGIALSMREEEFFLSSQRYPKGVVDPDPLRLSFSFPYRKNRLSMTIPAGVPVMLASHGSINGLILSHFL